MKKLRRIFSVTATFFLLIYMLSGCGEINSQVNNSTLKIAALNFPAYDFARQIAGGRAEITLLIPPSGEVHTYDPTVADRIAIENCDIFIYTGGENDAWAEALLLSAEKDITAIKMVDASTLLCAHDHGDGEHHHEDEEEIDEHVWTSPTNAISICKIICEAMCGADEENAEYYRENTERYILELEELTAELKTATEAAECRTIVFADRFAMRYFTEEFGFEHISAFPGCSHNAQASAKKVAEIIDFVKENNIPTVFYAEFSDEKLADSVCEATGAKKALLHSAEGVTKDEFESGITYIDIMKKNLETLREAL